MSADVRWLIEGRLAILPQLRGGQRLEDEIRARAQQGVQVLLTLLEPAEELELGLFDEVALAEEHGLDFLRYPLPPAGVPRSPELFAAVIRELADSGKSVGVHCRAGSSRSGLAAAALLVCLGHEPDAAFALVSRARDMPGPDTAARREWLLLHTPLLRP